jgi:transcriptional regulator with XRE-family HTH domain
MMNVDPARNPLRRARLAAGLEIRDLEERTRISPAMLRRIDQGEFQKLPAGIYARAWVRAVAVAVGLDPVEVLRDLEDALPRAVDPVQTGSPPTGSDKPPGSDRIYQEPSEDSGLERWRRVAAAVLDGIFLSSLGVAVWMLAAVASAADPNALGMAGVFGVTAMTAAIGSAYFVLFAGIGGRTPGATLLGFAPEESREPLDLSAIGRRAAQAALQEISIVVELMIPVDLPPAVERRGVNA